MSTILQEIWCRSVVLSVSSPNEPKSRVFSPNVIQEKHEEAAASYADLRMEIAGFHDATYKANENTNTTLRNYEKLLAQFKTQNSEGINKVLIHLKEVQDAVKEDPALNKKVLVSRLLLNLFKLLSLLKMIILPSGLSLLLPWPGVRQPFSKPSQAVCLSWHLPSLENAEEKKETPSQPRGEQDDMTVIPPTSYPKTPITLEGRISDISEQHVPEVGRSSLTLRVDKGKGIAKESYPYPLKLVKASNEICPDLDALVLIDYEINEKMHQITHKEL
ncbi:hypothetical protein Tco_0913291 [Tanacetum coccineum]